MVVLSTIILKFGAQGEKTGWQYVLVPAEVACQLIPGNKKSFRVKGHIDDLPIEGVALLPIGEGDFIMALKAGIRRAIGKGVGERVLLKLEVDKKQILPPDDLLECLADEPGSLEAFSAYPKGHQTYFINWINSAKTIETRAKRIAQTVTAVVRKMNYGEMIRTLKADNELLFKK